MPLHLPLYKLPLHPANAELLESPPRTALPPTSLPLLLLFLLPGAPFHPLIRVHTALRNSYLSPKIELQLSSFQKPLGPSWTKVSVLRPSWLVSVSPGPVSSGPGGEDFLPTSMGPSSPGAQQTSNDAVKPAHPPR